MKWKNNVNISYHFLHIKHLIVWFSKQKLFSLIRCPTSSAFPKFNQSPSLWKSYTRIPSKEKWATIPFFNITIWQRFPSRAMTSMAWKGSATRLISHPPLVASTSGSSENGLSRKLPVLTRYISTLKPVKIFVEDVASKSGWFWKLEGSTFQTRHSMWV